MFFVFCLILKVSGSSATWDKFNKSSSFKWLFYRPLTCVNFPFAFSKSAWYFTFDWSFVFSAILLSSGVSAIVVALALGMCLQEFKKRKHQLISWNAITQRRWAITTDFHLHQNSTNFREKPQNKKHKNRKKNRFTCTLRNVNVLCGLHNDAIHLMDGVVGNWRWIERDSDCADDLFEIIEITII